MAFPDDLRQRYRNQVQIPRLSLEAAQKILLAYLAVVPRNATDPMSAGTTSTRSSSTASAPCSFAAAERPVNFSRRLTTPSSRADDRGDHRRPAGGPPAHSRRPAAAHPGGGRGSRSRRAGPPVSPLQPPPGGPRAGPRRRAVRCVWATASTGGDSPRGLRRPGGPERHGDRADGRGRGDRPTRGACVAIFSGYASPDVLDLLKQFVGSVLVYEPKTFAAEFGAVLNELPVAAPAPAPRRSTAARSAYESLGPLRDERGQARELAARAGGPGLRGVREKPCRAASRGPFRMGPGARAVVGTVPSPQARGAAEELDELRRLAAAAESSRRRRWIPLVVVASLVVLYPVLYATWNYWTLSALRSEMVAAVSSQTKSAQPNVPPSGPPRSTSPVRSDGSTKRSPSRRKKYAPGACQSLMVSW